MRELGWERALIDALASGTQVVGICGGLQMLGTAIRDPEGVEAPAGSSSSGLGLLQVETGFSADKQTSQAVLQKDSMLIEGYEIHAGETTRSPQTKPFGRIMRRASDGVDVADGGVRPDGSVWGTYLHGLFHHDEFRHSWLGELGWLATEGATLATPDAEYDRVADALETTVGWPTWEQFLFSPC